MNARSALPFGRRYAWVVIIRRAFAALLATMIMASSQPMAAGGTDAIETQGVLSDSDFYHLATCGALPDGDCRGPYVRWGTAKVTVAMLPPEPGFPKAMAGLVSAALDRAIAQINGAEAQIRLIRRDGRAKGAQIVLTPTALVAGARASGLTNIGNGAEIGVGYMSIAWSPNRRIQRSGIAIAADIAAEDVDSVVLEELFQTLGFIYDIDNPEYQGRSVLSETSNQTTQIQGQDRKILRMHYPSQ